MERVRSFDIARGFAVALVVMLHATLLPESGVRFAQPICRMALLMLISGVLAAPALERGWRYGRDRSLDLLWMLFVWTPIALLARDGALGLARLPLELVAPSTHLWYIAGLALLVPSVALLRGVSPLLPLGVTGAGALWHTLGGRTGVASYDQLLHFALFFYLGLYGRNVLLAALVRCGPRVGAAAGLALAAALALPIPHSLATLGSAAMLLLIAQGLAGTRAGTALAWFGRRTPDIYLAHFPLLIVAGRLVGPFGIAVFAAMVIGVIAACLAIRALADRGGLGWLYRRPRPMAPALPARLRELFPKDPRRSTG